MLMHFNTDGPSDIILKSMFVPLADCEVDAPTIVSGFRKTQVNMQWSITASASQVPLFCPKTHPGKDVSGVGVGVGVDAAAACTDEVVVSTAIVYYNGLNLFSALLSQT